ncbi:ubiquitin carboxyl-terminal hydrolase 12-like [Sitodiplosis mosellana]|uniref:ubiquitin carboxyl-terminal hydrolase 12-like n=1 Tax=Sitodiplosis mosellana TaxID=263140 RepID=UPI002444BAA7|nr:ubiquitin carboxyl-terminal hydrolase 12-like [Sitodiplosis mosellana]
MAPPRKLKYPDLDSGPRKKLCLPKSRRDIMKRAKPILEKIRVTRTRNELNGTEMLIMQLYEAQIAADKYEKETGKPAHWMPNRRKKAQKSPQHDIKPDRMRSPSPIRAHDDDFETIDYKLTNNNAMDSVQPFESVVASSTPISSHRQFGGKTLPEKPVLMGVLRNIGNTCYMNAVLYSLRFITAFPHNLHHFCENMLLLFDETEAEDRVPENSCARMRATAEFVSNQDQWPEFQVESMDEKRRIIQQLHAVFLKLTEHEKENDSTSLRPTQFQKYAYNVNSTFVPGTQQDSHELLMCLLDSMRDCGEEYMGLVREYPALFARVGGDVASLLNFNYVHEHFMGTRVTTLKCFVCESRRTNHEDIIDLTVPLTSQMQLDENFIKNSCLEQQSFSTSDGAKCDTCRGASHMRQTTSYRKLPRILIVHLGRFDNKMNKVHIATPTPFNMDCFCLDCMESIGKDGTSVHRYTLMSVIIHLGATPKSGHYIAYVRSSEKNPQPQFWCAGPSCCHINMKPAQPNGSDQPGDNQWYICDDDRITPILERDLQVKMEREADLRTPYVLFYVRDDMLTVQ